MLIPEKLETCPECDKDLEQDEYDLQFCNACEWGKGFLIPVSAQLPTELKLAVNELRDCAHVVAKRGCTLFEPLAPQIEKQLDELTEENTALRKILADSELPCVHCDLSKEDWNRCAHGFPGCARADDMQPI